MRANLFLLKRIVKLGLLLVMSANLSACAGLLGHSKSWKEEVVLHDGKVIVVERYFNLGNYPTLDSYNRSPRDQTITFTLPESNKEISWKTEYRNDLPEPNSLGPLLLDVVGGVPYLATSPAGCISYNKWKRPNPPYVLFKYVNDEWKRITLDEFPAELVHSNLMSEPDIRILKSYYTVDQVKEQMRSRDVADFARTILREAAPKYGRECMEEIRTGDGWMSIDWFSSQKSYESCLKVCEREKVTTQNCPCTRLFKGAK